MEKVYRGGELPKSPSASGVVIGGSKTLEEFVAEEEAKEMGETLTADKRIPYHKARPRYADEKGKREPVRVYTRREINAENWRKIMESQKSIEGVISSLLLSGREVRGKELQANCVRQLNIPAKKYSTRSTYLFHKTDFGKFIQSRRDGKGAAYKLVPAALDCKPEELMIFIYKGNAEARETVLQHHQGLRPYIEEEKKKKSPPKKLDPLPKKPDIVDAISNAVAQELGVNVRVSGRVEIVFKLGN